MASQTPKSLNHSIFQNLPVGIIVYSADAGIISANEKAGEILGLPPAGLIGKTAADFPDSFVGSDGTPLSLEEHPFHHVSTTYQVISDLELGVVRNGAMERRWVLINASPCPATKGESSGTVITFTDITGRRRAEATSPNESNCYKDIFKHMSQGFAHCRMIYQNEQAVDWVHLAVNKSFSRLTGLKNVIGKRVTEVIPDIRKTDPHLFDMYGQVAATGKSGKFEIYLKALDAWFSVSVYSPQKGYFVVLFDVITKRKRAETEHAALLLDTRKTNALLSAEINAMQRLHNLGNLFLNDGNLQEILSEVVNAAIDISGADFGNIQLLDPLTMTLRIVAYRGFPDWWICSWNEDSAGKGSCGTPILHQERIIVEDIEQSPIFIGTQALEYQRRAGVRAVQSTPLYSRSGRLIGIFSTHYRTRHHFTERTLKLIDLLARQAADIIDRSQSEAALKANQIRLGLALDAAHAGIWEWNLQTNVNFWSEEVWKVFGLVPHSVKPSFQSWLQTIHPDDRAQTERTIREAARTASEIQAEWRILRTDGTERWIMSRGQPVVDEQGKTIRYNGVVIDISEHKRIEKELFSGRATLETALASMTDAVFISDSQGRFIHCNDAFATFHKFKNKDECAKTLAEYPAFLDIYKANGELVPLDQWVVSRALRGETGTNEEYTLHRKDTGEKWIGSYSYAPICDRSGNITGAVVVGRDITNRKEAEWAKLQQLKDRYRAIVMDQNDMIFRCDPQGKITFVNDAYCRAFGVDHSKVIGTNFRPDIHPDDLSLVNDQYNGISQAYPCRSLEYRVYLPGGELHWQQWSGRALFNNEGKIIEYQAVGRDITDRKRMEKQLSDELRLRQLFLDALPGVALLTRYGTREVIAANRTAMDRGGLILGLPCYVSLLQEDVPCPWCLAPRLWETGEAQRCRFFLHGIHWDAHWIPIEGEQLYLHYLTDVSAEENAKQALIQAHDELEKRVKERTLELQKFHAQLLHSEKLSAVGNLSASIAHEFNNPLQSVMTILKGIRKYISLPEKEENLVGLAIQECNRMKNLITDLRDFYRPSTNRSSLINLQVILDGLLLISKHDFHDRDVTVTKRYGQDLPLVYGVSDQLKQVFLNLFNNASYACVHGGLITVVTEKVADEVVVRIQDNGTGIKDADLPHIFEPFFTTKPELKGTGLGLSVSYGIIKQHGGRIEVASKIDEGSIFSVFLPIRPEHHEK
jgi:PAS domain S-box-containing protein